MSSPPYTLNIPKQPGALQKLRVSRYEFHEFPTLGAPQLTSGQGAPVLAAGWVSVSNIQVPKMEGFRTNLIFGYFGSGYTPQNKHGTWKWTLGKGDSYWKPSFPGSMLIFGGKLPCISRIHTAEKRWEPPFGWYLRCSVTMFLVSFPYQKW